MLFPTIIVDNFFDEPDRVREYGLSLSYEKFGNHYAGVRTKQVESDLFGYSTIKMKAVLYPMNYITMEWEARQSFQKISGEKYKEEGWVHQDSSDQITAIIYLSKHKNCGTSICKPKDFDRVPKHTELSHKYFKDPSIDASKELKENNERFDQTVNVESIYNRLLMFDSCQFHMANAFGDNVLDEDRLILITFFHKLTTISGEKMVGFPLVEMRRA